MLMITILKGQWDCMQLFQSNCLSLEGLLGIILLFYGIDYHGASLVFLCIYDCFDMGKVVIHFLNLNLKTSYFSRWYLGMWKTQKLKPQDKKWLYTDKQVKTVRNPFQEWVTELYKNGGYSRCFFPGPQFSETALKTSQQVTVITATMILFSVLFSFPFVIFQRF